MGLAARDKMFGHAAAATLLCDPHVPRHGTELPGNLKIHSVNGSTVENPYPFNGRITQVRHEEKQTRYRHAHRRSELALMFVVTRGRVVGIGPIQ